MVRKQLFNSADIFLPLLQVILVPIYSIPLRTLSPGPYIVQNIVWYQVVRACIPSGACGHLSTYHHQAPRSQNDFGREQSRMDVQTRGHHRRPRGRNRWSFRGVQQISMHTHV